MYFCNENLNESPCFFRKWVVFPCIRRLLLVFISTAVPQSVHQPSGKMHHWRSRGQWFDSCSVQYSAFCDYFVLSKYT